MPRRRSRLRVRRGAGACRARRHLAMRADRGAGIVIDCSKHLDRVISVDVEGGGAGRARGGARPAEPALAPGPAVLPSTRRRRAGRRSRHDANNSCGSRSLRYGNMVHNVLASMRCSPTHAGLVCEVPGISTTGACRNATRAGPAHAHLAPARGRGNRAAFSEGAAAGRRLQHRLDRRGGTQHGAALGRLRGTLAFFNEIELELQPIPAHGSRICHFPDLLRRDGATQRIVDLDPSASSWSTAR